MDAALATNNAHISEEQNEEVRLLDRLVRAEGTSLQGKNDAILQRAPDWLRLEESGLINPQMAAKLTHLHTLSLEQKGEAIENDLSLAPALVAILRVCSDLHAIQYVLTLFYELVRENSNRYEYLLEALKGVDLFNTFNQLLERHGMDAYTSDRSAYMLSGFMCRSPAQAFAKENVEYFVHALVHGRAEGKYLVSETGRLDAFANLLKIEKYRVLVWNTRGVPEIIMRHLTLSQPAGVLYKAVFCVWLMSFHAEYLVKLGEKGIVTSICEVIKESRVEKVVRVCLNIIHNFLGCEFAVETIIEENIAQILTLLEFEKWRDSDMYDDIRSCTAHLDQKIRQFNNFDRYCLELDKGIFKWSVLHSEKFWHENVMCFEKDEFSTILRLVKLLDSPETRTQAIACYDIGEFARLHPAGKKVCQKFKIKDMVMLLISNKDREVAGEALLCLQKLMLNNWQDVAMPINK